MSCQSLASQISYSKLCGVYENVLKARGNKKVEELGKFLNDCREIGKKIKAQYPDADISLYPIVRLFLPSLDRERGPHGLKEKSLAALLIRVLCLGHDSPHGKALTNYKQPEEGKSFMRDFAEKLYWVVKATHANVRCEMSVESANVALDEIARRHLKNENKDAVFVRLSKELGPIELKWFVRTLLKDMNLGMGQRKIFQAYHIDANELFALQSDLRQVCNSLQDRSARVEKNNSKISVFVPFKPMLLERCSIEDIGKFFCEKKKYFVEIKYDGERCQIHMKNEKFKYYSRHATDLTSNWGYGESRQSGGFLTTKIIPLLDANCRSIILDGELMGYNKQRKTLGSKGMPYDVKKLTAASRHQPCFVAFDILMYNDKSLVDLPFNERREILKNAFRDHEGVLIKSSPIVIQTSAELLDYFNKSLDANEEGIVLKRFDGLYKPNVREGSGCFKIKAEYSGELIQDLDMIILGAYYGERRGADAFGSFLMGVAEDGKNESKKFLSVVSVSTGLTAEQVRDFEKRFKPYWMKKCPENVKGPTKNQPDVWIEPKHSIILQLRATELTRCSVHPARYTLRFPRVVKVRHDKPWEDAWTLKELQSMIKEGGFVQKITKRHATSGDIRELPASKGSRGARCGPSLIDAKYLGAKSWCVERRTRIFEGKEFCVLNGEEHSPNLDNISKSEAESILLMHSARLVQNPGDRTFAIIVGNPKTEKVKNVSKKGCWDVIRISWLKRVTEEQNWHQGLNWLPCEVISCTEATERLIGKSYDRFYDSYTEHADEDSLERSLSIAKDVLENDSKTFGALEHAELESELFENQISPFGLFDKMVGYFEDVADTKIYEFRFLKGTTSPIIDASVSHVFVKDKNAVRLLDLYKQINNSGTPHIKICNSQWIEDCFEKQLILPENEYLIA